SASSPTTRRLSTRSRRFAPTRCVAPSSSTCAVCVARLPVCAKSSASAPSNTGRLTRRTVPHYTENGGIPPSPACRFLLRLPYSSLSANRLLTPHRPPPLERQAAALSSPS